MLLQNLVTERDQIEDSHTKHLVHYPHLIAMEDHQILDLADWPPEQQGICCSPDDPAGTADTGTTEATVRD